MARILFVDRNDYKDKLGIYHLSAVLKKAGHRVEYCEVGTDDVHRYFNKKVDFVLYSIMSCEYAWFKSFNRQLKQRHCFRTIVGGSHFSVCPEDGVKDPDVDFVVRGPGELVIKDIVSGAITQKLVVGTIPDYNSLPAPDRSIVYKYPRFRKAYLKRFIACRDCPYHCSYCHNHLFHAMLHDQRQRFFQRLAPKRLVDDVIDVRDRYGLGIAVFNDDDFAVDPAWVKEFCAEWRRRKVNVPFSCFFNARSVSDDSIKRLAGAGLHLVSLGVESANPVIRERILHRIPVTNERIAWVVRRCIEEEVQVKTLNMIGLPVPDPLKDAMETLEFNRQLGPTLSSCCILVPFPHTRIYQYCLQHGYLRRRVPYIDMRDKTILHIKDAQVINRLCKWWSIFVKHKLSREWIETLLALPVPRDLDIRMRALSNEDINALYYPRESR